MTWKLTVRGSADRPIAAEYLCPVHGRFTLDVERDANGDPPAEMPCGATATPESEVAAFRMLGVGEADDAALMGHHFDSTRPTRCGITSPYVISAPARAKVRSVEAVRGGYERPERPTWTDTTNLGEGQTLEDWQDDRAKVWEREREREVMQMAKELG